ncbi:hypothetical protein PIB30_092923, partial [Stylosanthes scabra]|nr:hypothetical protein [Stylosanthes scabra]
IHQQNESVSGSGLGRSSIQNDEHPALSHANISLEIGSFIEQNTFVFIVYDLNN